jgi:phosphatidylserine/phosphatidylglycerophosphate/cardiolipin synthase-like enzyme
LRKRIRNASRSIRLALFTITHKGLVDELIRAHKRGVEVTLVVDMHSGLGASAEVIEKLRSAGARLLFSQGTQLLHHKFAFIDEQLLVMGSANWTKAAFQKNCDSLIFIHSLNESQKQFMKRLWQRIETEAKQQLKSHS